MELTQINVAAINRRMARKTKFPEKMVAAFPDGTFARIAALLDKTEDRTDLIREAVERELKRRERVQN
jgi:hypothetical protein